MIDEAVGSIRQSMLNQNVDLELMGRAVDVASTDPLAVYIEFMHASPLIKFEFSRLLGAKNTVDLQLAWLPENLNAGNRIFRPQIRIPTCHSDVAARYVTEVLKRLIPRESAFVSPAAELCPNCCQGIVILEPQLKRHFITSGKPNIDMIWNVVQNESRQRLTMGIEHFEPLDNFRHHICSKWTYISTSRAQYRWKIKVIAGEVLVRSDTLGVLLHTNLVAEKASLGSSNFRSMADFVVSRMGHEIVQQSVVAGFTPDGTAANVVSPPSLSTAFSAATSLESHLESILLE